MGPQNGFDNHRQLMWLAFDALNQVVPALRMLCKNGLVHKPQRPRKGRKEDQRQGSKGKGNAKGNKTQPPEFKLRSCTYRTSNCAKGFLVTRSPWKGLLLLQGQLAPVCHYFAGGGPTKKKERKMFHMGLFPSPQEQKGTGD